VYAERRPGNAFHATIITLTSQRSQSIKFKGQYVQIATAKIPERGPIKFEEEYTQYVKPAMCFPSYDFHADKSMERKISIQQTQVLDLKEITHFR